jgi:hypothetical protein
MQREFRSLAEVANNLKPWFSPEAIGADHLVIKNSFWVDLPGALPSGAGFLNNIFVPLQVGMVAVRPKSSPQAPSGTPPRSPVAAGRAPAAKNSLPPPVQTEKQEVLWCFDTQLNSDTPPVRTCVPLSDE